MKKGLNILWMTLMMVMMLGIMSSYAATNEEEGDYSIETAQFEVNNGIICASWDKAPSAVSYKFQLYRNGAKMGYSKTTNNTKYDVTLLIKNAGRGTYYFTVYATYGDPSDATMSDELELTAEDTISLKSVTNGVSSSNSGSSSGSGSSNANGVKMKNQPTSSYSNTTSQPDGWAQNQDTSWSYYQNHAEVKSAWVQVDANWYHFDENGKMQTGWLQDAAKWYYCNESGVMLTNATTPDGYKVDENGVMVQ